MLPSLLRLPAAAAALSHAPLVLNCRSLPACVKHARWRGMVAASIRFGCPDVWSPEDHPGPCHLDECLAGRMSLVVSEFELADLSLECRRCRCKLLADCARPGVVRGFGITVPTQEIRDRANESEAALFVGEDEFGNDVVIALAGKMFLEPSLVAFVEREVSLSWVDDLGARIDPCLGRVGFDQRLRKAMNGRADKLVERFPCSRKVLAL